MKKNTKRKVTAEGGNGGIDGINRKASTGLEINSHSSTVRNHFSAINMPQPIFVITENINLNPPSRRKNKQKTSSMELEETYPDGS